MEPEDSARSSPADAAATRSFHTVTDTAQAKLLTDAKTQFYFRPFVARDATASEVAAELGVGLNAVLYRIRTFLAAGLLRVVEELPRKGRAVKVYRSVHDAYFIPYEVTPFATLEERLVEQLSAEVRERARLQARRMEKSGRSGQRLYRNELGEVWTDSARDAGSGLDSLAPQDDVSIDYWTDILLTEAEATELRATLYTALRRFEGRRSSLGKAEETDDRDALKEYRLTAAFLPLGD